MVGIVVGKYRSEIRTTNTDADTEITADGARMHLFRKLRGNGQVGRLSNHQKKFFSLLFLQWKGVYRLNVYLPAYNVGDF